MNKLNNKGYLTIEIILASVMTFAIAFFLIEITVKLVNKTDDYNIGTLFTTDKALIIKNIKQRIDKEGSISNINKNSDTLCTIGTKDLTINNDNRTITYGDYTKKINDSIKGDITITKCLKQNEYIVVQININDIFTDESRDINIVTYNG